MALSVCAGFRSRFLGVLLATLAVVPAVSSCTKAVDQTVPADFAAEARLEGRKIVGAVEKDGTAWSFKDPGANVVGEELVGTTDPDGELIRIPIADLSHLVIEEREGDTLKTTLLVVGIVVTAAAIIGLIVAASDEPDPPPTTESCPFIYSWDGTRYVLDAEPYGGATTRGLERDDFTELEHLVPTEGTYRLRVRNELAETQHTNQFELWVVEHEPGTRVVADVEGGLHTIRAPNAPLSALDEEGRELLPWLSDTDHAVWEPMPSTREDADARRSIVLEFERPDGADRARLISNAATGLWGSHMIRELLEIRGEGLVDWYEWVDSDPQAVQLVRAWSQREELFELKVWVEEPTGWELRGLVPGGGPYVSEDRVVPLDLSRVTGDRLRIRLDPPAGFWALNSFAVDWGPDEAVDLTRLPPTEARDANGTDLVPLLSEADGRHHVMERTGEEISLAFVAPEPTPGRERTLLLHSRGYYRLHGVGSGAGDPELVSRIEWLPGAVHEFSARTYEDWIGELASSAAGATEASER